MNNWHASARAHPALVEAAIEAEEERQAESDLEAEMVQMLAMDVESSLAADGVLPRPPYPSSRAGA